MRPVVVSLLLLLSLPLAAQDDAPSSVDRAQLMRDLTTLASPAFEGRRTGSPGSLAARQWIVDQFRAAGLTAAGSNGYVQPFTFSTTDRRAVLPGGGPFRTEFSGANVLGRLTGREPQSRVIIVTAHYDHLGIRDGMLYPGADDNASGVVALLAAARHFRSIQPRHSMLFAAFDGEEQGQRGAHALLDSSLIERRAITLNVNLDMVSRSEKREIYAAGTSYAPWLTPLLKDAQARSSVKILFGHDQPSPPAALEDWTHESDHGPFHDAGIAWVYFGVEDHADYHTPTDTAARVDPGFYGDAVAMIIEALRTFDTRVD